MLLCVATLVGLMGAAAHVQLRDVNAAAETAAAHRQTSESKITGLQIKSDTGGITFGTADDVSISRNGAGSLLVSSDLEVDGTLTVADENFVSTISDWHVFVGAEPITLKQGVPVSQSFTSAAEYELSLDIYPTAKASGWTNILHMTATGDNCCDYGDRIPAIWFFDSSTRLHIVAGSTSNGNSNFNPEEEIPLNEWTTIRIRVEGGEGEIYYNEVYKGTINSDMRMPHDNTEVWLADPWHTASSAQLRNVKYRRISYHQSLFYNQFTSGDVEDSLADRVAALETAVGLRRRRTSAQDAVVDDASSALQGSPAAAAAAPVVLTKQEFGAALSEMLADDDVLTMLHERYTSSLKAK